MSSERIPVIIAARNEEAYIAQTLAALDTRQVEPLVVVNDSSDRTYEIANTFGCHVEKIEQPGKVNAIQTGLRRLGVKAMRDVLFTDADTYPKYPSLWPVHMKKALYNRHAATGLYVSGHCVDDETAPILMSGLRVMNVIRKRMTRAPHTSGANMIVDFSKPQSLERVLDLDEFSLRNDLAVVDAATEKDLSKQRVSFNPLTTVVTSSRYIPKISDVILIGKNDTLQAVADSRAIRFGSVIKIYER